VAVVVAVIDDGVVEVDLGELVALAPGAGDVGECQVGHRAGVRGARTERFMEARGEFEQDGICVGVLRIEQGARHHRQTVAQAGGGFRVALGFVGQRVQRQEDAAQAGVGTDQQVLDAAILEEFDRHALKRAVVVGDDLGAPAAMPDHVGENGAVAVKAADVVGVVEHIRDAHAELVVIGDRLAQFVEGGRVRHQLVAVLPEGAQVEVELAFHIGEQRAVAFALQHGVTVGELQAEVVLLSLGMVVVIADAVFDPVFQAGD
jgi:hypothetical protein